MGGGAAGQELRLPALATDDVESPSAAAGSNVQPIFKTESRFMTEALKRALNRLVQNKMLEHFLGSSTHSVIFS